MTCSLNSLRTVEKTVEKSPVTVLITGIGAPGSSGTLWSLKHNWEDRKVRCIGADINDDVALKFACDKFYQVPLPSEPNYSVALMDICRKEDVDVVLPQCTDELLSLSIAKNQFEKEGITIAVSSEKAVRIANNKKLLYDAVSWLPTVDTPKHFLILNRSSLEKCASKLGWPEVPVVLKPCVSHGSRGLRIIDARADAVSLSQFYEGKPSGLTCTMDSLRFLGEQFSQRMLVSEFLPGPEYTVDVLANNGESVVAVPRRRDEVRGGVSWKATVCRMDRVYWASKTIVNALSLSFACGFQFKTDGNGQAKLLECNPRVQGGMVASTFANCNIIYGAVKLALGEALPEFHIAWGTRLMRYLSAIHVEENNPTLLEVTSLVKQE